MAIRVPTYRERQVQPQNIPTTRVQVSAGPEAFGMIEARGLGEAAERLGRIAEARAQSEERVAEQLNKARAMEAEKAMMDWQIEYLHNPDTGAFNRRGGAAINVSRETLQQFEAKRQEVLGSLDNDAQRLRFESSMRDFSTRLFENVSKFERDELQQYGTAARGALIETAKAAAIANATRPEIAQKYTLRVGELMAEDPNNPPELVNAQVAAINSQIIMAGMEGLEKQGNAKAALDYYNQNKDFLTGPDANAASAMAARIERGIQTTQIAEEAVVKIGNEAEALRAIEQQFKDRGPEFLADAKTRTKQKFAEARQMADFARASATRETWNSILSTRNPDPGLIPQNLPKTTQDGMRRYIENAAKNPDGVKTDRTTWQRLENMYLASPGAFAQKDLSPYMADLSPVDAKEFLRKQQQAAGGLSEDEFKRNQAKAANKSEITNRARLVADEIFGRAGWSQAKGNKKKFELFETRLQDEVLRIEQEQNKIVTLAEADQLARKLLLEGVVGEGLFGMDGPTKRLYETLPSERKQFYVPFNKIPREEVNLIRKQLGPQGLGAGANDRIEEIYNQRFGLIRPEE